MTKTERWKGLILVFIIVYFTSGLLKNESSMTKRTDEDMAEIKTMNPSYQEDLEEKELGTLMDTLNGLNLQDFLEPKQNISNIIHSLNNKKTKPTTLEELNIFSNLLLNQQEVGEGRSFGCSSDIKQKFARCLGKCKDISCNIKELQNFLSACRSGTKKLCIGESESTLESIYKCQSCGLTNATTDRRKDGSSKRGRQNNQTPFKPMRNIGDEIIFFPWQALVMQIDLQELQFKVRCGGSIINNRWILTAGRCLSPGGILFLELRVRDYDALGSLNNSTIYLVIRQVLHPKYKLTASQPHNDFGLLELDADITFNEVVRPICLPEDDSKNYDGLDAIISGWGYRPDSPRADRITVNINIDGASDCFERIQGRRGVPRLRLLDLSSCLEGISVTQNISGWNVWNVSIDANTACKGWNKSLLNTKPITANQLCTDPNTSIDEDCFGDTGGPLVVKEGDRYIQVGILSYGGDCFYDTIDHSTLPQLSTIYSRVSKELDWIKRTTSSGTCN